MKSSDAHGTRRPKTEFVVYRALYGDNGLWNRPKKMFLEEVEMDGKRTPRFQLLCSEGKENKGMTGE